MTKTRQNWVDNIDVKEFLIDKLMNTMIEKFKVYVKTVDPPRPTHNLFVSQASVGNSVWNMRRFYLSYLCIVHLMENLGTSNTGRLRSQF